MLDVEALYRQEHPALCRWFARRLGDDRAVADDLAAEVFARVWAKRETYQEQPGIPVRVWLFRIARNLLTDHWRRRRPYVPLDELTASYTLRFDEVQARREIMAALDTLPDRQRAIIIARYWEGRRHDETGDISTVNGSKKLQDRALVNLRKYLGAA